MTGPPDPEPDDETPTTDRHADGWGWLLLAPFIGTPLWILLLWFLHKHGWI